MDDHEELSNVTAARDKEQIVAATPRKIADRRIQRLHDLYSEALQEPHPLRANLRAAAADLLEISFRLSAAIKTTMGVGATDMDTYKEALPAIGSLALINRQATRYIQLDRDWGSEEDAHRRAAREEGKLSPEAGEMKI